jgi:hypothetical protein
VNAECRMSNVELQKPGENSVGAELASGRGAAQVGAACPRRGRLGRWPLVAGWALAVGLAGPPFGVALIAAATAAAAPTPAPPAESVTAVDPAPPSELAAAVRDGLGAGGGLRVVLDGEPLAEIWLNQALPAGGNGAAGGFGVAFPGMTKGGLVGAVRLLREWSDYRGSRVAAGVYTLRYAVEPADGAHTGVSLYRDFLILVPAAADDGRAASTADELVAAGRGSTGGAHPAVLALFPPVGEGETPRIADNELGQPMLVATSGEAILGLVLAGRGDLP